MHRQKSATSTEISFCLAEGFEFLNLVGCSETSRWKGNSLSLQEFLQSCILISHVKQIKSDQCMEEAGKEDAVPPKGTGLHSKQHSCCSHLHHPPFLTPLSQICTLLLHDKAPVVLQLELLLALILKPTNPAHLHSRGSCSPVSH